MKVPQEAKRRHRCLVRWLLIGLLLLCGFVAHPAEAASRLRVVTYNLRNDNTSDTADGNGWASRLPLVVDMVKKYGFDVFGTQEGKGNQIDQLKAALSGYACFGLSRDGNYSGEHSKIFYRTARLELLQNGDFWLSKTPAVMSVGWDAALVRIATWGRFRDRETNQQFLLINAHFDHIGTTARIESAKLVLQKMSELAGTGAAMFMGDLNVDQSTEAYAVLKNSPLVEDAFDLAATRLSTNVPTFNGWKTAPTGTARIDHVFLTSHFSVIQHQIATDLYNGKLPSDHFPVIVDLEQNGDLPRIVEHPASLTVAPGKTATFSVQVEAAVTAAPNSFQWSRDGVELTGSTVSSLTIPAVAATDAGSYTVTVKNVFGATQSRAARLTVAEPVAGGLANLSVRAVCGSGGAPLIAGFVIAGEARPVLLRGVGPSLATYGVSNPIADPVLQLYAGNRTLSLENDNWGGAAALTAAFQRLGAFALSAASQDAALLAEVSGLQGVHLRSKATSAAVGMIEVYDAGTTQGGRFANLSVRNAVGTGERVCIAGFLINGNTPLRLLLRGVGPTLADFGVSGALADPVLTLNDATGKEIARADDWTTEGNAAQIRSTAASIGAFALRETGKDAALLLTLPAGLYSVVLAGSSSGTGEGMIEIYDVR